METSEPSSSSDPSAAAGDDYPRWVVFVDTEHDHSELQRNPCPIITDIKTVAHARTSTGYPVRASFRLAAPPAASHLDLDFDDGLSDKVEIYHNVVAAHGDSVLIRISTSRRYNRHRSTIDFFVYRAGGGTDGRLLPSLSLLPPCYIDDKKESADFWWMMRKGTAILRCGDGEFVVATNLTMNIQEKGGVNKKRAEAKFHQLRSSELQWKTERLLVQGEVSSSQWVTDKVIAVADRFFYWVDLHEGIVFSDVCEESPQLRFVPLPVDPGRGNERCPDSSRSLSATDGGAAVKFVLVCPRCCCGGPGATKCALSRHAFTVTTWTLRSTQAGGMGWEKDGVVDSGELWALDAYRSLPRVPLDLPMVSIDDPDVIFFFLSEHWHIRHSDESKTWVVMIDTRTKSMVGSATIISTELECPWSYADEFLPSQVSSYFNTSRPGSRRQAPSPPASERHGGKDLGVPQATETCGVIEVPPATDECVGSPGQMILAALQEIPGLTPDEMLRAYGVLACDDRRRYQTLMALPMDMRRDYCCMLVDAVGTNKQANAVKN